MHWIEAWRRAHGVSRDALAARVRWLGGGCSAALIASLEEMEGCVTHPGIAARIAAVTGATAQQWDSIVPKCYRGQWMPGEAAARAAKTDGRSCDAFAGRGAADREIRR